MRGRSWVLVVGVLVVGALIVGCSASPPATPVAAPSTTVEETTTTIDDTPWTSDAPPAHSGLSATKDSIVYAAVVDRKLRVVALDPATGEQRWKRVADVGTRSRGVEASVLTDDDSAYFLMPANAANEVSFHGETSPSIDAPTGSILVGVETATGKQRWRVELDDPADSDIARCGDFICVLVETDDLLQMRRFERRGGAASGKYDISLFPGRTSDATVATRQVDGHKDVSQFVDVSVGPVALAAFSLSGAKVDWAARVSTIFPGQDVSPEGGWAGWPTPAGWLIWLGQADDELGLGAVAGVSDDGSPLWLRADRHACVFIATATPVLCDGTWSPIDDERDALRPNVIEGVDPANGAATWSVDLGGSIDEFAPTGKVVRVDEDTFLLDLATGTVALDLATGPAPQPPTELTGWCTPGWAVDSIGASAGPGSYTRTTSPFPCRLGGEATEPSAFPIPDFAGVNVDGWSAWIGDDRAVHGHHST